MDTRNALIAAAALLWVLIAGGSAVAGDPPTIEIAAHSRICIGEVDAELDNGDVVVNGKVNRTSCWRGSLVFARIRVTLLAAAGTVLEQVWSRSVPPCRRSVRREARQAIEQQVSLPPGYSVTFGGQFESQQRAMRHLSLIMLIVLLIIFVVLLTTFGRVLEPVVILLSIPLTLVGGVLGLFVAGETLNVSSTIGLIALFGIGVQNDVILVAKISDLIRTGEPLRQAVLKGSLTKLRAILMTNVVMIVGVLPLALGVTSGAELHRPLAVVYIGGFLFAILLKMIAVPALYEAVAGLRGRWLEAHES